MTPRYLYLSAHPDGGLRIVQTEEGADAIGPHNALQVAQRLEAIASQLRYEGTFRSVPTVLPSARVRWQDRERDYQQDLADARYEASKDRDFDAVRPDPDVMQMIAEGRER